MFRPRHGIFFLTAMTFGERMWKLRSNPRWRERKSVWTPLLTTTTQREMRYFLISTRINMRHSCTTLQIRCGRNPETAPYAIGCSSLTENVEEGGVICRIALPEHFRLAHPVGTVLLGNTTYGDFLVVLQGVTVGRVNDSPFPKLGKGLFLGAGAKVIGGEPIGDRVSIGVNALVYKQAIPDDSVVTARGGHVSSNRG